MDPITNEDILAEGYDLEELVRIFSAMSEIEGLTDFIRKMIYRDLVMLANVPNERIDMVRGGYFRLKYLLKLVQTKGDPRKLKQALDKKE